MAGGAGAVHVRYGQRHRLRRTYMTAVKGVRRHRYTLQAAFGGAAVVDIGHGKACAVAYQGDGSRFAESLRRIAAVLGGQLPGHDAGAAAGAVLYFYKKVMCVLGKYGSGREGIGSRHISARR